MPVIWASKSLVPDAELDGLPEVGVLQGRRHPLLVVDLFVDVLHGAVSSFLNREGGDRFVNN
jgi:hypothetical protein